MRIEPEQTGELSGLDQQRDDKAERGRRAQAHPERTGADEAERHEEDDVHDDLMGGEGDRAQAGHRFGVHQKADPQKDLFNKGRPADVIKIADRRKRIEGEAAQTEEV